MTITTADRNALLDRLAIDVEEFAREYDEDDLRCDAILESMKDIVLQHCTFEDEDG